MPSSLFHPHRPPRIGVTGSILAETESGWAGLERSYTNDHFVEAIAHNGGIPFILPLLRSPANTPSPAFLASVAAQVAAMDGIIFSGGHDLHPSWYGEEPEVHLSPTFPERDLFDMAVLAAAVRAKKPILGVCRGMQLINVFFGGKLIQDLGDHRTQVAACAGASPDVGVAASQGGASSEDRRGTVQHLQRGGFYQPTHKVTIQGNSALAAIVGGTDVQDPTLSLEVNSLHHQAVDQVAPPLEAVAWAQDGVIEAIELARDGQGVLLNAGDELPGPPSFWRDLGLELSFEDLKAYPFLLGVQWHPEMLYQPSTRGNESHNQIFQALVKAAKAEKEYL